MAVVCEQVFEAVNETDSFVPFSELTISILFSHIENKVTEDYSHIELECTNLNSA